MSKPALALVPPSPAEEEEEARTYEFNDAFQIKIAGMVLRDPLFNQRTDGLVKPEYFTNAGVATLVNIALEYYGKYKRCPDVVTLTNIIRDRRAAKLIRSDVLDLIKETLPQVGRADISDRDYVVDQVAVFAQHQAMEQAIIKSVDLIEKRDFQAIRKLVEQAIQVGASADLGGVDYFENIEARTQHRRDLLSGAAATRAITTGIPDLDKELAHGGWGRKELSLMMGAAKAGKSMSLCDFGQAACLAGYNVLYATLEVSAKIIEDRLDANLADIAVRDLKMRPNDVEAAIKAKKPKKGIFKIHEFPTGTMKPSDLRRLLARYRSQDIRFDLIIVDYADIMAPEIRSDSPIENFRTIYVDLRAIAGEEDAAMLTATQTNREGAGKSVAKMTDVAEDFNKIRIADVVISINATDEEKSIGEARLFFAASRNQADGFTLRIKQDREKMKFITKVLGKE
ncbi:DnaB-like helicase C-terminal domain-containing protein [Magnetospirillum molischianum]|uniref:Putative DNA helicase n=1 Tax=Magnetospirillum molischianum DSM 120 TaxID=1150626 RepID=H8FY75_MAGML|nr:DnaB-like helicase C-terminal domain-containing protein [Magnetospirillum molischianum]CCG43313.1 putative DNA helicase [Magnetospirillum molischianum DSM 120]